MTARLGPSHTDRARAMRAVLAMLRNDGMALKFTAGEADTPEALDRLFMALVDMFAAFMRRKLKDPHGYVQSWIALELQLAEDEGVPPTSQTGDVE